MITCTTEQELRDALNTFDIPAVTRDMVYDNVVLGRTYTPGRGKRNQRAYSEHVPGHGDLHITGPLYEQMSAAAVERSRNVSLRDRISRTARANIKRNNERYGVAVSDATHAALRIAETFDGDLAVIGRAMAAELVAMYASVQRDAVVTAEGSGNDRAAAGVSGRADRVSRDKRPTAPLHSPQLAEEFNSGAVRLYRNEQNVASHKNARI